MKLLLYCCKNPHKLYATGKGNVVTDFELGDYYKTKEKLNGKIVAECDFEVDKLTNCGTSFMIMKYDDLQESYRYTNEIARGSCLDYTDLRKYLGTKDGYAIHIKNLHIFDEPYELGKALIYNFNTQYIVEKASQNMMKVYNRAGECHILISIRPEWLCKILNKEKTVEIRKKVLKEMLE